MSADPNKRLLARLSIKRGPVPRSDRGFTWIQTTHQWRGRNLAVTRSQDNEEHFSLTHLATGAAVIPNKPNAEWLIGVGKRIDRMNWKPTLRNVAALRLAVQKELEAEP